MVFHVVIEKPLCRLQQKEKPMYNRTILKIILTIQSTGRKLFKEKNNSDTNLAGYFPQISILQNWNPVEGRFYLHFLRKTDTEMRYRRSYLVSSVMKTHQFA